MELVSSWEIVKQKGDSAFECWEEKFSYKNNLNTWNKLLA